MAEIRFRGSKTNIFSNRSIACGSAFLNLALRGCLSLGQRLDESEGVFAADGFNDILWWCPEEFGDDGELVDMILAREQGFALEHFCKDTAGTPDIHLDVVFLPSQHDFRGAVVAGRDIARHLRILDSGETEVTDLQIAILVDENVAGLQVSVDNACRVDIFQTALHVTN